MMSRPVTQQLEAVVLQSGQSGSGGGLQVFGRRCFSARSDDTDRWLSVTFFPPLQCKACHKEFVNRKGLRSHECVREEELLRLPFERRRFPPVCVDVAERRDGHQYKKRGTLANIGQEQEEQVKMSRLALTLEKDDPKVTHSDKMHRATHEDAHAKAWFGYCRKAFSQPVRKASPDVDFLELNNELKNWLDT